MEDAARLSKLAIRSSLFFLIFLLPAALLATEPSNELPIDIDVCNKDSDCVVVPHAHCCGTTKKMINIKYLKSYKAHPSWQRTDGGICAVIGQCQPNDEVTKSHCEVMGTAKRCTAGARTKKE